MRNVKIILSALVFLIFSVGFCSAQTKPPTEPATRPATQAASVLKPGDRILFIGDSITGLGERNEGGFVRLIREALAATHKDSKFELVTLGCSGATVGAWNNIFGRAADPKEKEFTTDVIQNPVKATLAKNWDVVIMMLGMNDVLQPQVNDEKESLANWDATYLRLIQTVRDRLHPRVVALGQCTLAGEDAGSEMNLFVYKLGRQVEGIAKKADCVLLPTYAHYWATLLRGRGRQADFHIMYDYIHPTADGHIAIAMSMAQGLSDRAVQTYLNTHHLQPMLKKLEDGPHIVCGVQPFPIPMAIWMKDDAHTFSVTCQEFPRTTDPVSFQLPPGWTITAQGPSWKLTGKHDRLRNVLKAEVKGQKLKTEAVIPAPWLITAGPVYIWRDHEFKEKDARTAIDDAIETGKDFTGPIDVVMQAASVGGPSPKTTGKLTWHRFFPSIDYTGGDAPGNVDFWSISYPRTFETGYAARWVWSDKDRPIRLEASSKGFTGGIYMQVWFNGKKEYNGEVSEEKGMKKEFPATLKKGWNCMVFRCCHRSIFFQGALEILPADKDDKLDDLRFSVVPKTDKSPGPGK